jgi:hypothetical protein
VAPVERLADAVKAVRDCRLHLVHTVLRSDAIGVGDFGQAVGNIVMQQEALSNVASKPVGEFSERRELVGRQRDHAPTRPQPLFGVSPGRMIGAAVRGGGVHGASPTRMRSNARATGVAKLDPGSLLGVLSAPFRLICFAAAPIAVGAAVAISGGLGRLTETS